MSVRKVITLTEEEKTNKEYQQDLKDQEMRGLGMAPTEEESQKPEVNFKLAKGNPMKRNLLVKLAIADSRKKLKPASST